MTREALLREVLKLPHRERAELAFELLRNLEDEPAEDPMEVQKVWAAEIERRIRRVLAGASDGNPWEELRRGIEGRLGK